jgi:hypothetical protein
LYALQLIVAAEAEASPNTDSARVLLPPVYVLYALLPTAVAVEQGPWGPIVISALLWASYGLLLPSVETLRAALHRESLLLWALYCLLPSGFAAVELDCVLLLLHNMLM